MSRDTQEELKRLDKALQEDVFQQSPTQEKIPAYNTDQIDEDLEVFSKAVLHGEKKPLSGLVVAVLLLAVAILGMVAFWLIRYRGLFL